MGILDIILLICFIPGIVTGISKGFVKQVVEFAGILLGAWAAFHFSSTVSAWLSQYIQAEQTVLHIISFIVIVLIIALLLNMLAGLLTKVLNIIALGWLNGILGLLFGILKVALILGLIIMVIEGLNNSLELIKPEIFEESKIYCALRDIAEQIFPYLKEFVTGINA